MGFRLEKVKRTLQDYWVFEVGRFVWNVQHLFKRDEAGTVAREDIGHSFVNVFVEGIRVLAYPLGHLVAYVVLFFIVAIPLNALSWLLVN